MSLCRCRLSQVYLKVAVQAGHSLAAVHVDGGHAFSKKAPVLRTTAELGVVAGRTLAHGWPPGSAPTWSCGKFPNAADSARLSRKPFSDHMLGPSFVSRGSRFSNSSG